MSSFTSRERLTISLDLTLSLGYFELSDKSLPLSSIEERGCIITKNLIMLA